MSLNVRVVDDSTRETMGRLRPGQVAALVVLSFIVFCFSGLTFGWASLVILLRRDGVYESECKEEEGSTDEGYLCDAQAVQFSLTYTLAQFCHVFFGLPVGFLLDALPALLGTRTRGVVTTASLGLLMIGAGFLLLADFSSSSSSSSTTTKSSDTLVLPAMMLLGCGGPTVFFPVLRCAEAFKAWGENHFISLMNALFDASAVVFALLLVAYRAMGSSSSDRRTLFTAGGFAAIAAKAPGANASSRSSRATQASRRPRATSSASPRRDRSA